ncbi:hypothetical protein [Microbacterium lushaniae]|uniref:Uncharacterized protein n=1 Tax=Microbacterium lushaniae TaxID=2614639 RepID=A0A5J6L7A7_9MICO|nr:hypothetical protein [Microbacterium lushaniae]QEW04318.1 hypothetical protein F6J85_15285 [Microbacterium lushaniae]
MLSAARARDGALHAVLVRGEFSAPGLARSRRDPAAPVDDSGSVLSAVAPTGELIATLVSFACHPTLLTADNLEYSRDYPGVVRDTVEEFCGGTAIFLQGFAGDVNPVFQDHSARDMQLFGKQIGAAAASAALSGLRYAQPAFTMNLSRDAVLPVRDGSPSVMLPVDRMSATIAHVDVDAKPIVGPDASRRALEVALAAEISARSEGERERAVAVRQACWIDDLMASHSPVLGIDFPRGGHNTLPVQVFRVGPMLQIIALPGEPHISTARSLRARVGDTALLVGYANAAPSYLPPAEAFAEHGYEVGSTRYALGTVERLADAAVRLAFAPTEATSDTIGGL